MRSVILAFKSYTISLLDMEFFILFREDFRNRLLDHIASITSKLYFKNSIKFAYKHFFYTTIEVESQIEMYDYAKFLCILEFNEKDLELKL